ncbi:Uncharacterised protein [Acinetobacter baumannii]|nr:Uncharacterised protein [Acinetobacter baumannii]
MPKQMLLQQLHFAHYAHLQMAALQNLNLEVYVTGNWQIVATIQSL